MGETVKVSLGAAMEEDDFDDLLDDVLDDFEREEIKEKAEEPEIRTEEAVKPGDAAADPADEQAVLAGLAEIMQDEAFAEDLKKTMGSLDAPDTKDLLERHEVPAPDRIDIRALAKHALTIFQPTKEANIATFHVAYVAFVYERWYHGQNLKMTSDQSPLETMQAVNTSWSGEAAEERINAIFAEHFDRLAYASEVV